METKQIINGLLDRADRVADQSAGRIMKQAAERLRELEERTKYKPAPELMPMGALTYAIACSHCGNRNKDAETCHKCRCEIESGFEVDPLNGWIPVTERLPEDGETVLVYGSKGGIYTAWCNRRYTNVGWHKLNSKSHYCNPTHWMPLPEPPKEVE